MRFARHKPLFCLATIAVVVTGCGGSSSTPSTTTGQEEQPGQTVSEAQISRAAPASPERTVLAWWRDVQLNDPEDARDLYLTPPTLPNLAGQFNFVAGELAGTVKVVSTERRDKGVVARVKWKRPDGGTELVTLRLREEGGEWKLLDTRFLDEMVTQMQKAEDGG